jgi:chromosome partitioning protein
MKTLAVVNEKGGVGKTTIAAHGGWFFSEQPHPTANKYQPSGLGLRVLLIDLDQQANLTSTMRNHLAPTPAIELFATTTRVTPIGPLTVLPSTRHLQGVEATANYSVRQTFADSIRAMDADYDLCIIDTPPSLATRTLSAILACDAVISPIASGDYSIDSVTNVRRAIQGVAEHYNRTPPDFLGLLPSIFDRRSKYDRLKLELIAEHFGQLFFPGIVSKRDSYVRAASERIPVWKMHGMPAKDAGLEICAVFDTVAQKMQLRPRVPTQEPQERLDTALLGAEQPS